MWLVVVEKQSEFDALSSVFLKEARKAYVKSDTPFGAPILRADADESKPYPSFLLLDRGWPNNKEALIWCYKNMKVDFLVSSGLVDTLVLPEEAHSSGLIFFPQKCVRSECNLDLLSGPLLYEEYPFDIGLQSELLRMMPTQEPRILDSSHRLFSTTKIFSGRRLKKILSEELGCMGFDDFSGELCRFSQSLNIPIGCLKVCSRSAKSPLKELSAIWLALFEAKAQEVSQI